MLWVNSSLRHLGCNVHPEREKYRVTITKKTYTKRGIDLPARPILSLWHRFNDSTMHYPSLSWKWNPFISGLTESFPFVWWFRNHLVTSSTITECPFVIFQKTIRSRKLTKQQIICQSANYLSFYKQILPFVKGQIDVFTFLSCMKLSCEIEFPHAGVC